MSHQLAIHSSAAARVGFFVDAQNIFRSLPSMSGPDKKKLDHKQMLLKALNGRTLYCARLYEIIGEETHLKESFLSTIKAFGYDVLTKPVQVFTNGRSKGDWDLGMAVDIISLAEKLDVVVLASGDGDFVPLVKYLKQRHHCRVEGISLLRTTSSALIAELDSHIDLGAPTSSDLFRS